jgi:hypothetical protein
MSRRNAAACDNLANAEPQACKNALASFKKTLTTTKPTAVALYE